MLSTRTRPFLSTVVLREGSLAALVKVPMDPDADLILDNHQAEVSATLMYVIEGVVLGIVSFLGVTGA